MLSSTQHRRKHRDLKKLWGGMLQEEEKAGLSHYFSLFPPSLCPTFWQWWYPAATVLRTGAAQDRDRGDGVLIGPGSIPSEKGWSNCSLPEELFYWAYLQFSSGMCDKPCILIFLPWSRLGPYCLQNCASAESPESFNWLETSWKVLNNHTTK